jgi:4-amino-4-deoxy-L-arabinose transferase-like glycosyltransferase
LSSALAEGRQSDTSKWHKHAPPETKWFRIALLGSVVIGALIRFSYIASFIGRPAPAVRGDGFSYHLDAIRLSEGLGYTATFWNGAEAAHHPPGWVTVLGGFSALGLDDLLSHQIIGALIGLLIIVVAALIGRRLFGEVTGGVAGAIAALYPGFWVLEAQILAEPLAILMLGLSIIALYRFSERTDLRRAIEVGVLLGLTALVRSELLALLVIVLPVILWQAKSVSLARRGMLGLVTIGCVILMVSPWAIFNAKRFQEPVLLSSNMGSALLLGNCPLTFEGEMMGFYDMKCLKYADTGDAVDSSVRDGLYRAAAIDQIRENWKKLPYTVAARYGRTLGVYRSQQTVTKVAAWHGTAPWPVWAWVISFWVVSLLAIVGAVTAIRARSKLLPLLAPIFITLGVVAVISGEPRYHTMADLSLVVLAALGTVILVKHFLPTMVATPTIAPTTRYLE